jgi:hypothetical protein
MEDEGFVEDDFIEETAWEYVALHGVECVVMLRKLAAAAEKSGELVSAQTWRAIAEAAERIIGKS